MSLELKNCCVLLEEESMQIIATQTNGKKKTRQGNSVNTKYGTKMSTKYYVKRYRGQGK